MFLYEGNEQYSFYKANGEKVFLSSTDLFILKDFLRDEIIDQYEEECKAITSKNNLENLNQEYTYFEDN